MISPTRSLPRPVPMKPSIPTRLFLAVLSACAVVLAVNGVAERFSFERVFLQ